MVVFSFVIRRIKMRNKIIAIVTFIFSLLPIIVCKLCGETEIDATYMVFVVLLCVCMFFSSENCFYEDDESE